ncbi:MAG: YceI family protein [Bacteroidales bacterium]
MKSMKFIIAALLMFSIGSLSAQLKIVPAKSNIVISGTSTLHAWDMKIAQVNGEVAGSAGKLTSLVMHIPVKSMKSAEGSIMDGKAYDAFDSKKNPTITFTMSETTPVKVTDGNVEVTLTGMLSMAGVAKKVSFKSTGKVTGNTFQMKGAVPVKMTEYGMKPPTAIFGTIKCGDAIVVKFDVTVEGTL